MGKLRDNLLTIMTLVGVISGLCLGLGLKALRSDSPWSQREANYIGYPGKIFLNMLKCMIIPLIVPSLIAAIGQLDLRTSGKIGSRAVLYYMSTTCIAVTMGIILTISIRPGIGGDEEGAEQSANNRNSTTVDTLLDLFTNCFPPNLVQATLQQYKTEIIYPGNEIREDPKTGAMLDPSDLQTWQMTSSWSSSTNILGLVVFSIATGIAISLSGEEGKPLLKFFQSVSHVMMKLTGWIVCLAPIGVCFLIAGEILHMKSVLEELVKLGWYLFVVCLGISLQGGVILPLIYSIVTRSLPFRFIGNMGPALATAFGTASSSATLPVTINNLENGNKVNPVIARFVLPIGATINMDGTALYEAVAAIFIAQLTGMNPSIGQIIIISITATAASIGAAGIPHAGLVTLVMVLETVGLPSEYVSIIMSVDWLVDRFRTLVNVLGDSFGAAIVAHLCKHEIDEGKQADTFDDLVGGDGGDNQDGEELSLIGQHTQVSKAQQEEELVKVIIPEKPKETDKFAYHTSRDRVKCVNM
eukprot:TRINITY_DN9972_c0_g2_i2.p1 TRINITY_DN9972_c0_g2~~TRINITY_DN9972_c0_g2_i2.p1  ORF type:complete len:528 (+),score=122.29 TRINITY_DN9972_c0_g2_i2:78-1661(+)